MDTTSTKLRGAAIRRPFSFPPVVQPEINKTGDEVWFSVRSGRQVAFLHIQQRPFG